jgi:CHRD domain-containing protein
VNGFQILRVAIPALFPAMLACGDDEPTNAAATSFSATLTGGEEVPAVTTPATGTATFELSGSEITYTLNVENLQNPVVAHIHIAAAGQNGPVRLNLCGTGAPQPACGTGTGVLASGTNGTTVGSPAITFDSLVSAMRTGGAYTNVHTDNGQPPPNTGAGDMASGEIRGQIVAN